MRTGSLFKMITLLNSESGSWGKFGVRNSNSSRRPGDEIPSMARIADADSPWTLRGRLLRPSHCCFSLG